MRRPTAAVLAAVTALLLGACYEAGKGPTSTERTAPPSEAPAATLPPLPWKPAAIAHGGASNPAKNSDGTRRAVDAALEALARGADPVDAAVAGVVVLEDDPRFNAGTGSRVRLDGGTVQMDASLMTSEGRFAAIGVIERVKNPIVVARALLDTPHLFLAGDGATRFARTLGLPDYEPATPEMKERAREIQRRLRDGDEKLPDRWKRFDWRTHWNFEKSVARSFAGLPAAATADAVPTPATASTGSDTVGVAVRSADGRFAVALSTGGTAMTLSGRVGDVPVYGAGLWAGPHGAIAATGEGERIIEAALAREMHGWLADGVSAEEATKRGVDLIREKGLIGVIVLDAVSMSADCTKEMSWSAREEGSTTWLGPEPGK